MQVDDQIIFDDVTQNDGGHYNPATGIFTVPIKGTYVFFLSVQKPSTSTACHIAIMKNGQHNAGQATAYAKPSSSVGTALISCDVGDTINVVVIFVTNTANELLAGRHTTFCGALVHIA